MGFLTSPGAAAAVAFVAVLLYGGIGWEHQFVFQPEVMQAVSRSAIARSSKLSPTGSANVSLTIEFVIEELRAVYGKYIVDEPKWMLNNAGGAMGSMLVRACLVSFMPLNSLRHCLTLRGHRSCCGGQRLWLSAL